MHIRIFHPVIEEYKFHQHKSPISINNIHINKIVVLLSFLLVNKVLNILLVTKMLKKLELSAYSV